jgi:hypothetical protein
VNLLFWLSYLLTDQVLQTYNLMRQVVDEYRPLVMVSVLSAVAGALFQRYVLNRKVSTGEPPPPIINRPAEALTLAVERAAERAAEVVSHVAHVGHGHGHGHGHRHDDPKPDGQPSPNGTPAEHIEAPTAKPEG